MDETDETVMWDDEPRARHAVPVDDGPPDGERAGDRPANDALAGDEPAYDVPVADWLDQHREVDGTVDSDADEFYPHGGASADTTIVDDSFEPLAYVEDERQDRSDDRVRRS